MKARTNFALQAGVLELGRMLAGRFLMTSIRGVDDGPSAEDVAEKTKAVLSRVRSSPARSYFGIGSSRTDADATRLKILAYVGWRILTESELNFSTSDIINTVVYKNQDGDEQDDDFCRRLLQTLDCVSEMIDDKVLVASPDTSGTRSYRVALPIRSYSWLCYGNDRGGGRRTNEPSIPGNANSEVPSARQLYDVVRQTVIGCDSQIRTLASRISLAVARADLLAGGERDSGVGNQVVVVFGSSGTGKTFVVEQLARASNLVFSSFDASGLSGASWAGSSVDDALKQALNVAKGDVRRASRSIVCFDEIDKALRGGQHEARQSAQADLLRPLGGHPVIIGGKRNFDGPPMSFDCGPTTFVLSGVFEGLADLAEKRGKRTMGFHSVDGDKAHANYRRALEEYGCIPEVCGRISAFVRMPDPSADSIASAVVSECGIVAGYNNVLKTRDIVLIPQADGVSLLADYGIESRTFFRGVKHIIGTVIEDVLFNEMKGSVVLDSAMIRRAIDRVGGIASSEEDFDAVYKTENSVNDAGVGQTQVALA